MSILVACFFRASVANILELIGIIFKLRHHPMVEMVPSDVTFSVFIPGLKRQIMFSEQGSMERLSAKFKFEIVSLHTWNITGVIGHKCIVDCSDKGIRFLGLF